MSNSVALVIGTALSTVFLMVVGELVPKNWAISSPLAVAKRVGTPQRLFSSAFRPFITHLNNTANHVVRRFGLEPAEELASARGRRSWWHSPGTPRRRARWRPTPPSCSSAPSISPT